jgi:hypothetical protein
VARSPDRELAEYYSRGCRSLLTHLAARMPAAARTAPVHDKDQRVSELADRRGSLSAPPPVTSIPPPLPAALPSGQNVSVRCAWRRPSR